MRISLWLLTIGTLALNACAPTSQAPTISNDLTAKEAALQSEMAVKELMAHSKRLNNVASPILIANAELCEGMLAPYLGASFASRESMGKNYQDAMTILYGTGEWPSVIHVAKKTPASGKLKVGDMVTHLNGNVLPEGKKGVLAFNQKLMSSKTADPVTLTVDRAGKVQDISIKPVMACNSPVQLTSSSAVNAFADGKNIFVTTGMMNFTKNDTELATIVGHELAHNTRAHMKSKRGNAMIGGLIGAVASVAIGVNVVDLGANIGAAANSQDFETEADYVGLYLTARGGYKIDDAPNLWRRMAVNNPAAIHAKNGSHPSTVNRFLVMEQSVKEIKAKKAQGKKLIPEERAAQTADAPKGGYN